MIPRTFVHAMGALLSPGCLSVWQSGAWHAEWQSRGKAFAAGSGTSEDAALQGLADELVREAGAAWLWDLRHGDALHGEQIRACLEAGGYATDFDWLIAGGRADPVTGEDECLRAVGGSR